MTVKYPNRSQVINLCISDYFDTLLQCIDAIFDLQTLVGSIPKFSFNIIISPEFEAENMRGDERRFDFGNHRQEWLRMEAYREEANNHWEHNEN